MESLHKLELKLADLLDKKAPIRMPASSRKSLGNMMWALALVFGVLMLWGLFDRLALRMLYEDFGTIGEPYFGFFYYLSLVVLTIAAALVLVSAPALKARKKEGWNLLFYAILVNVVYGVLRLFTGDGGLSAFIWALITSLLAAYFIFQVRGQFKKSGSSEAHGRKS